MALWPPAQIDDKELMLHDDAGRQHAVEADWETEQEIGVQLDFENFLQDRPQFETEADAWEAFAQSELQEGQLEVGIITSKS